LVKTIVTLTIGIFVVNFALGHAMLDALLFALAIAVGLTPELLPVIVTISLSHGAGKLAKKKVIAKQLIAIENLGNMDVLCTDKTGTLTEGSIELVEYANVKGERDPNVLLAALTANTAIVHKKIIGNGIDAALWKHAQHHNINLDPHQVKLCDEPFDYDRKAMFSVIEGADAPTMIVKGAPDYILQHCRGVDVEALHATFARFNNDGLRVIAIAQKKVAKKVSYVWDDVHDLELMGYATFLDVPKLSAKAALAELHRLNVSVKIITGDNELVTLKICKEVGMDVTGVLLGAEMEKMSDDELKVAVVEKNIFARLTPDKKERIIKMLREAGHTVGFMGDGINDIPALRAGDVGISVNTAVDVAKDAASIVLLDKGLDVIAEGITEGRRTFSNTLKYILMSTSSNFGNMFSAAGASFFLPFLPMTPVQILLTNGLFDLSQLSIPTDNVDPESLIKPRHWNIDFIKHYMLFFGPISSIYDFLTFGVMIFLFHAQGALFQTGWFIESVATEILVVFVIRTSRTPFFSSTPGKWLVASCFTIVGAALILPFTPLAGSMGFVSPPPLYFFVLIILVSTYLLLVEFMKTLFLKRYSM
jgi:Mg2+-importing ATPase